MNKVLVTGGAGFIGSHIVEELLTNNYEVAVLDNLSSGKLSNIEVEKVKYYEGDIVNEQFVNNAVSEFKPDYIIHQAAQVSVVESVKDILNDEQINIRGSLNIINAARLNNVERIVFASSAAVYGNPQYLPIDESHPTHPMSPYGLSKLTVEKYLEIANSLYGLNYTILRYSNVYGPRQDAKGEGGVISIFVDKLMNNEQFIVYGDGEQTRDFIFVKDVAKANVKALSSIPSTSILNVSNNNEISINKLITELSNLANYVAEVNHVPERDGDIKVSTLANDSIKAVLDWTPRYSLNEGLVRTIQLANNNQYVLTK